MSELAWLATAVTLGLSAGLTPGPTMSLVVAQSLRYGAGEGARVAIAPLLTDAPIIALALWAVGALGQDSTALGILALVGALLLAYFGVESLRIRTVEVDTNAVAPRSILRGVLANGINPHPYLFWFAIGGPLLLRAWQQDRGTAVLFVATKYTCMVGAKLLIAVVVARGRRLLGTRAYLWTMRLLGLSLIVFAALFVREGLRLLR